jgi:hypothetical protein
MADTIDGVVERLSVVADALGVDWADYGQPGEQEYRVVIDSAIDYMATLEGSVAMELPNVGLKVDRDDDGVYNVYLKIGSIGNDGES